MRLKPPPAARTTVDVEVRVDVQPLLDHWNWA
jgi:hypothetical protein